MIILILLESSEENKNIGVFLVILYSIFKNFNDCYFFLWIVCSCSFFSIGYTFFCYINYIQLYGFF